MISWTNTSVWNRTFTWKLTSVDLYDLIFVFWGLGDLEDPDPRFFSTHKGSRRVLAVQSEFPQKFVGNPFAL